MKQSDEIKTSLKREYYLYANAVAFYEKALHEFEQKYQRTTHNFLKEFEAGQIEDEADYFDWYAFAKLLAKWSKTQSAIRSAIQRYKNLLKILKRPLPHPLLSYLQILTK